MTTAFGTGRLLLPTFRIGPAIGYRGFVFANRKPRHRFCTLSHRLRAVDLDGSPFWPRPSKIEGRATN